MVLDVTRAVEHHLEKLDAGIVLFWGTSGSGKTAAMWTALEDCRIHRPKAMYRYPEELLKPLDSLSGAGYRSIRNLSEVGVDEDLVLDDTALYLFSRNWSSKDSKAFIEFLSIARHKDVVVWLTCQSLRLLDVLVFEPVELLLVQKFIDFESVPLERDEYQVRAMVGNLTLEDMRLLDPVGFKSYSYVHRFGGVWQTFLVPFWNSLYSKPYRGMVVGSG